MNYPLIGLCIIAGIRVGVYSAAFPFIGNVDEGAHVDLVYKYNKGHFPKKTENYAFDNAILMSVIQSCEYIVEKDQNVPLPWWKSQGWWIRGYADTAAVNSAASQLNHESMQPPLYYLVAGLWLKAVDLYLSPDIGGHRRGFYQLYGIRFLNVALIVLLVWIAYLCADLLFKTQRLTVYGITAVVALMPQDIFYSVQNDVLSPVCFGLAFLVFLRFLKTSAPSFLHGMALGITCTASALVKLTNLPLVFLITLIAALHAARVVRGNRQKKILISFSVFLVCAWTPVLLWFLSNYLHVGSLTASDEKIQQLTWTAKPFSEWGDSLLLTFSGFSDFWRVLMITFWRGELIFHRQSMGMPVTDAIFWISTTVFLIAALLKHASEAGRLDHLLIAGSFLVPIISLIMLSLMFDFGDCGNPSRLRPYFTSGRLMSAAIIPFCIIYVRGFEYFFSWLRNKNLVFALLLFFLALITWSEVQISGPVFKSNYNLINM